MHNSDERVSASEINRYIYCPYQWYYERYYGRKLLREKSSERNRALGYTDASLSNFNRGREFHENYMARDRIRRLVKVIIKIIIAVIILLAILAVAAGRPEIAEASPTLKIFGYRLFYADQKSEGRKDGVIYSKQLESVEYGLYGKPDFIFKRRNNYIPVELKSGTADGEPRKGDLMQLCAYMLIIEDVFSAKVPEGRLIYNDTMFKIRNTRRLRSEVMEVVYDMRQTLKTGRPSTDAWASFAHCRRCICKGTVCEHYNERV